MPQRLTAAALMGAIFTQTLDTMGTGYMVRARDYDRLGGIPAYPSLLFADHELWIRLSAISYLAVTEKECFSFWIHQSISRSAAVVGYVRAFFRFLHFIDEFRQTNLGITTAVDSHLPGYIRYYCTSLSHRLLKTPVSGRDGMTVELFTGQCRSMAAKIVPGYHYNPNDEASIRWAKRIDKNAVLRWLYLMFRKFYNKPFYS